jgi:histidine ammonia-lyase
VIRINGHNLTIEDIGQSVVGPVTVEVAAEARDRVSASHRQSVDVSAVRPIYGRSTGVGANRTIAVAPDIATAQSLLASHATSSGPARSADRVRSMMTIRLNQLCAAGSGIRPAVVDALARMINADDLPPIAEFVGIGTADLSALATTAIALQESSAGDDEPLLFGPHDALPFMSSNAAALADAAIAYQRMETLSRAALVVAALSFAALRGNAEAYAEAVELATPMLGARRVCDVMRSLVGEPAAQRIQDPYGLRVLPQGHGVLLDALAGLCSTIETYVNAPSENPLVLPDGSVAHHGGFHATYLALACDTAAIATVQSAQLALNRLTYLSEPNLTASTPFLGDGTPGASGVMVVEYVAAAALGDLRAAASPASVQTIHLSRGVEDTASFAALGARQLLTAADRYQLLVAAELLAAARAVRLTTPTLTPALANALECCRELPEDFADRDLTADLVIAQDLLPKLALVARN